VSAERGRERGERFSLSYQMLLMREMSSCFNKIMINIRLLLMSMNYPKICLVMRQQIILNDLWCRVIIRARNTEGGDSPTLRTVPCNWRDLSPFPLDPIPHRVKYPGVEKTILNKKFEVEWQKIYLHFFILALDIM